MDLRKRHHPWPRDTADDPIDRVSTRGHPRASLGQLVTEGRVVTSMRPLAHTALPSNFHHTHFVSQRDEPWRHDDVQSRRTVAVVVTIDLGKRSSVPLSTLAA